MIGKEQPCTIGILHSNNALRMHPGSPGRRDAHSSSKVLAAQGSGALHSELLLGLLGLALPEFPSPFLPMNEKGHLVELCSAVVVVGSQSPLSEIQNHLQI
uniref:Uncharacterized protein n=1 Tax=Heterosigma akashiwo TaxID=2829 RepID=A0A7S3XQQ5_HETAK|mmetsp:Transcript_40654/g.72253  ORF Transcript_40654/g.72253 Transcript_40654/m.72253 type:complete len:101 (-) Transcript_40654:273-575(-)